MKAFIMRILRGSVAQVLSYLATQFMGINVPIINVSAGIILNGIFKAIRDKFPTSPILEWLPL